MNPNDNARARWTRRYELVDANGAPIRVPVTVDHDGVPVRVYRIGEHHMVGHTLSGDVWLPPERYGWRITAEDGCTF